MWISHMISTKNEGEAVMVGIGSGRTRNWTATTDDYRSIDVRLWNREGWLAPHQSFLCSVVTTGRGGLGHPRAHRTGLGDSHRSPP